MTQPKLGDNPQNLPGKCRNKEDEHDEGTAATRISHVNGQTRAGLLQLHITCFPAIPFVRFVWNITIKMATLDLILRKTTIILHAESESAVRFSVRCDLQQFFSIVSFFLSPISVGSNSSQELHTRFVFSDLRPPTRLLLVLTRNLILWKKKKSKGVSFCMVRVGIYYGKEIFVRLNLVFKYLIK